MTSPSKLNEYNHAEEPPVLQSFARVCRGRYDFMYLSFIRRES